MAKSVVNDQNQVEIAKIQEKIINQYRKRLTPKFQKELQTFAMSGKQIGSSEYFKPSPIVQEIFMKMSIETMNVYIRNAKNPFKKLQYWIAKVATQQLAKVKKPKKKKK